MTAKEALERLVIKAQPYESGEGEVIKQSLDELEELKERDTAMKAKIISHLGAGLYSFVCGNCGKYFTLDSAQHNYCIFCGQKINWSEKNE